MHVSAVGAGSGTGCEAGLDVFDIDVCGEGPAYWDAARLVAGWWIVDRVERGVISGNLEGGQGSTEA